MASSSLPGTFAASEGIETAPDLCELYTMNRLGEPGVAEQARLGDAYGVWSEANRWPDAPAVFRATWLEYYSALEHLATDLMRLFAYALGLEDTFFATFSDQHISNLTANYYPPVLAPPLPGQYRKGPAQ